jgi:hypothetical protein
LSTQSPHTLLALASYEKGHAFLRQAKQEGVRVFLLTSLSLKDTAQWPRDCLDDIFYMPDEGKIWNLDDTLKAVSYLARTERIDRIVPLDDFDLEMAAMLRETLRIPGMGDTTTRYFRDKLARRVRARTAGIAIPDFVHLLNDAQIHDFTKRNPAPWVVKPRSSAGAIGIKKAHSDHELWTIVHALGDDRVHYVLEKYVPGDIFHVDSLVQEGKILFVRASKYGRPPLDVSHGGDVFTSRILAPDDADAKELIELNATVLAELHLLRGASHTEFIRGQSDGKLYFLETSARVGGAHLADMIDAATGINLWAEWAKIELAGEGGSYELPKKRDDFAGLVITLAKQERPDTSAYDDPEIVWRLDKRFHVGVIVRSPSATRVAELVDSYVERFHHDFHAKAPPLEKASS